MAAFTAADPDDRDAFDAWIARERAASGCRDCGRHRERRLRRHRGAFTVDGDREVTFWIARHAWGRGVATEALRLLVSREAERPLFARVAAHNVGLDRRAGARSGSPRSRAPSTSRRASGARSRRSCFALVPALDGS